MFSFNVLGDGLKDALDPRLRKIERGWKMEEVLEVKDLAVSFQTFLEK